MCNVQIDVLLRNKCFFETNIAKIVGVDRTILSNILIEAGLKRADNQSIIFHLIRCAFECTSRFNPDLRVKAVGLFFLSSFLGYILFANNC